MQRHACKMYECQNNAPPQLEDRTDDTGGRIARERAPVHATTSVSDQGLGAMRMRSYGVSEHEHAEPEPEGDGSADVRWVKEERRSERTTVVLS